MTTTGRVRPRVVEWAAHLRIHGVVGALLVLGSCTPTADVEQTARAPVDRAAERAAVDDVLTSLHRLASEADWDAYFGLYAPDAVFLGTDATERWTLSEFRAYAAPTDGWTYRMTERHIYLDPDGNAAWFDERLENAGLGETRGTGALVRTADGWKITQYNLTIPVPNELAREVVERIRAVTGASGAGTPVEAPGDGASGGGAPRGGGR